MNNFYRSEAKAVDHLRIVAQSSLELVRVKPSDLQELLDAYDALVTHQECPAKTYMPEMTTLPVLTHTMFMNMQADDARAIAVELDLIGASDNPDLSPMQQAQVWWLRAEHGNRGNELIQAISKKLGHPTSSVGDAAPITI